MPASRFTPYRIAMRAAGRVHRETITPTSATTYAAARERGESVTSALTRARTERVAARVLTPTDTTGRELDAYDVDGPELTAVTSSPQLDALAGTLTGRDGVRILSRVTLPDGAHAIVRVYRDDDGDPDDAECYSPDDVEAWRDDQWQFVFVEATVTLPDGREGTDAIGGVEMGDHWPGTDAAQIWHVVPGVVAAALADARAYIAHTTDDAPVWTIATATGSLSGQTREAVDLLARFLDVLTPPMPYEITRDTDAHTV